jgi:uncharacterized protein (TIGR03435 family)
VAPSLQCALLAFLLAEVTSTFDVASVKSVERAVGPDLNNHISFTPQGISEHNATLRRLIADAYNLQIRQIQGPAWLDRNEYDVEAKAGSPGSHAELAAMLGPLLRERFALKYHRETKEMPIYELVATGKAAAKLREALRSGFCFEGDLHHFADFLAVQFTIHIQDDPTHPGMASGFPTPVLDRTNLSGDYTICADVKLEPGSDMFILWQRALQDDFGLKLTARKRPVEILVVDSANPQPISN